MCLPAQSKPPMSLLVKTMSKNLDFAWIVAKKSSSKQGLSRSVSRAANDLKNYCFARKLRRLSAVIKTIFKNFFVWRCDDNRNASNQNFFASLSHQVALTVAFTMFDRYRRIKKEKNSRDVKVFHIYSTNTRVAKKKRHDEKSAISDY